MPKLNKNSCNTHSNITSLSKRVLISVALILIFSNDYLNFVNSCYITNCPWGGKRAYSDEAPRQCHKCADGLGTCFGPKICCGADIGCLIDTKETLACRLEDLKSSKPCSPYGKSCNKLEFGKCATNNLCCNPEYCMPDASCSEDSTSDDYVSDKMDLNEENKTLDEKLLKVLSRLIGKKNREKFDTKE